MFTVRNPMEPGQTLRIDMRFILRNIKDFFRWWFKRYGDDRVANINQRPRGWH